MRNTLATSTHVNVPVGWLTKLIMLTMLASIVIATDKDWNTCSAKQEGDGGCKLPKVIDPSKIKVGNIIKSGGFGDVYEGNYCPNADISDCYKVAIKTIRAGYNETELQDLMDEASIMAQLDHPNVVKFIGLVANAKPPMIIMEYMEKGTLQDYVQLFNIPALVGIKMLRDIAHGMAYLAEKGIVHRDLAARNILIDDQSRCKISDFGLSRKLKEKDDGTAMFTSTLQELKYLTIHWMAPEAIMNGEHTSASDVWSFGVVIWQMVANGETPTSKFPDDEAFAGTLLGYHQFSLKDMNTRYSVFPNLIRKCWNMDRKERPTFEKIVFELDEIFLRLERIEQHYPAYQIWFS